MDDEKVRMNLTKFLVSRGIISSLDIVLTGDIITFFAPVIQQAKREEREWIEDILNTKSPRYIAKKDKYSNGWNNCRDAFFLKL